MQKNEQSKQYDALPAVRVSNWPNWAGKPRNWQQPGAEAMLLICFLGIGGSQDAHRLYGTCCFVKLSLTCLRKAHELRCGLRLIYRLGDTDATRPW